MLTDTIIHLNYGLITSINIDSTALFSLHADGTVVY